MSKTKTETETSIVKVAPSFISPTDAAALAQSMFGEGFAEEQTFGIGDPASKGTKKVPYYLGELIGDGGDIMVEQPGAKPDPSTGEVKMSALPVFLFNPVDPTTLAPFRSRVDNIIASHQVANACRKYGTLAKAQGGVVQLFFRWVGKTETRKGNQMNVVDVMFRVIKRDIGPVEAV